MRDIYIPERTAKYASSGEQPFEDSQVRVNASIFAFHFCILLVACVDSAGLNESAILESFMYKTGPLNDLL